MTTTIPTPEALLTRAADILDERGWFQGGFVGPGGCVCVGGAINIAAAEAAGVEIDRAAINGSGLPEKAWDAREKAWSVLRRSIRTASGDIGVGTWNDKPNRTKPEVQAALRRAAEAGAE